MKSIPFVKQCQLSSDDFEGFWSLV